MSDRLLSSKSAVDSCLLLRCLVIFILATPLCYAQNEYSTWYVGDGGAIEFSTGYPVSIPGKKIASLRSPGMISDPETGRVLFYTDGVNVYDSTDQLMLNGDGIGGEFVRENSETPLFQNFGANNVVVVPAPCDDSRYYILTTRFIFNGLGLSPNDLPPDSNEGLRFSVVDMRLNGGLGAVVEKNVQLTDYTRECIAVTLHENGRDYWVAVQLSGDSLGVIPLRCDGFGEPVVKRIPREPPIEGLYFERDDAFWAIEFAPGGQRVALAMMRRSAYYDAGRLLIYDFDPATGQLGDSIELPVVALDVEFSPDGSKLYTTRSRPSVPYLSQYDLSTADVDEILKSRHVYGGYPELRHIHGSAVESTPTGQLIVSEHISGFLSIIENPNEKGAAAEFWYQAIPLISGTSYWRSLPHVISHRDFGKNRTCVPGAGFEVAEGASVCSGPVRIHNTARDTTGGVTWTFEGGLPEEWSGGVPPSVVWSEPGEYRVTQVVGVDRCTDVQRDTLVRTITVLPTPTVRTTENLIICGGERVEITPAVTGEGLSYQWSPATGLDCVDCLSPTARPSQSTTYTVTVSNQHGCVALDSVRVIVDPAPIDLLVGDTVVLSGDEVRLPVHLNAGTVGTVVSNLQIVVEFRDGSFLPTRTEALRQWLAGTELEDWVIENWSQSSTTITIDLKHGGSGEVLGSNNPLLSIYGAMFVSDEALTEVRVAVNSPDLGCYSLRTGVARLSSDDCGAEVRQMLLGSVRYREATVTHDGRTGDLSLSFAIGIGGHVSADLYSMDGGHVAVLLEETLPAGTYRTTSNLGSLSAGTYLLRLECGSWRDSKLVVVR